MLTIPPGSRVVIPGCVHLAKAWVPDSFTFDWLYNTVRDRLEPHRGFRGFPDHNRSTLRLGLPGVTYVYNGSKRKLHPFSDFLPIDALRQGIEERLGVSPNCAYVNFYANGDGVLARHSDIPLLPQLGQEPVIVAASFGATRKFQFWSASAPRDKSLLNEVELGDRDLCIMHGRSQLDWLHGVPRQKDIAQPRLSITFRFHNPA